MNNKKVKILKIENIYIIISMINFYKFIIQGVFTNNKILLNKMLIYYLITYLIIYCIRKICINKDIDLLIQIYNTKQTIKKHLLNKLISAPNKKIKNL